MATTALVDDVLPSYHQALSILQRSGSTPSTDDEKRQYQQEVLNILNKKTTANDFMEKCKVMAQAALDVDSAFDRGKDFIPGIPFHLIGTVVVSWIQMREVSE